LKKLLKYISPFAPDNSGAAAVLYELGGIVVICDAGGCAGNVCGFDEPRWFEKRSALFSAGLRDMDAILGRDDRLAEKLAKAAGQIGAPFTAIIGTPVPAVIATDYRALKRLSEKKTGLPALAVDTTGTNYYDKGEEKAYMELFKTFSFGGTPKKGKVGVIGATPLDLSMTTPDALISALKKQGCDEPVCFGMNSGLEEIKDAGSCEKLLAISPGAVKAAEYLSEKFHIPYETGCPDLLGIASNLSHKAEGKRILIVHQQFAANSLRSEILSRISCDITCASWFMTDKRYMEEQDLHIPDEETFTEKVQSGGYDIVIADISLKRAVKDFKGEWIDYPHFAVSGRLAGKAFG